MENNNFLKKNLAKILGGDPEKMSREEFNQGLENYFQKLKKQHKDPFEAKEILNQHLQEAFSKDFLKYNEHKNPRKQLEDVLSMYGLTPEQIKKVDLEIIKGKGYGSGSSVMGGGAWLKENPAFKNVQENIEFLKKGEFTPHIMAYDDNSSRFGNVTIPHEALHAANYFLYPESQPYMEPREKTSLKDLPAEKKLRDPILESIKKDPSLKNILFQSKSSEHFQPITPLNPPGYYPHEFIFNKLHPYKDEPVVIPPEQPEASGIFSKIYKTLNRSPNSETINSEIDIPISEEELK